MLIGEQIITYRRGLKSQNHIKSIEYIHLANRGFSNADASEEELFLSTKQDYDTHVFKKIGFEVVDVKSINWDMTDSEFQYSAAHNPNFKAGKIIPTVTSILAKRTKSQVVNQPI